MKKAILALLLAATTALGQTDTIKFRTDNHAVKKPPAIPSGVDYDFTGLNVIGIAGTGGGGGTATPGGAAGQMQFNSAGTAFGGVPALTWDGTTILLKAGTTLNLADPTDTSKKLQLNLAGISGTKTVTFPNLSGTLMMADITTPPTAGHIVIASSASTVTNGDLNGAVTTSGTTTTAISPNAITTTHITDGSVTLPKLADMSGGGVVIGRMPPGTGPPSEVTTANWDTAFTDRLKWDGGPTGLVPATGRGSLGATTIGSNFFTATNPSALTYLRVNADNSLSFLSGTPFKASLAIAPSDIVGASTVGSNLITLANPSAITFLKVNADNTVATESATTHLTSLGGTTVGRGIFTAPNPSAITFLRINADNSVSLLSNTTYKIALALTPADVGLGSVTNDAQIKASDFPSSVTSGQLVTFNGATGKSVQASVVSGMLKATSGVVASAVLGTDYWNGNTFSGTVGSNSKGLVPDPGPVSGTGARFLRDDGLWVASGSLTDADKGDITVSGAGTTWTIDNAAVTYAKIQTVNAQVLLGRTSFGPGAPQEITVGSGLSLLGTTLTATGGGGGGNVSNSGTPSVDQMAVWTDATHIKGVSPIKGGATGTFLKKASATDYDWIWATPTINSIQDPGDATKQLVFDIHLFNPSTTWTVTPPAANSVTVAPLALGVVTTGTATQPMICKGINGAGTVAFGYPDSTTNSLTADKTDWNLNGNTQLLQRWSGTAVRNINSLSLGQGATSGDGMTFWITNTGTFALTIKHESATGSTAANKFHSGTGADIVLAQDQQALVTYDSALQRWRAYPIGQGGGGAVSSVFGRTGAVVATTGDYTAAQVGAEPALGNPSTNGFVLSSTTAGVRSWVAQGGGGITALTGDVTASGSGSVTATIANSAVTYAKMQNTSSLGVLLGRGTLSTGAPQEITAGTGLSITGTALNPVDFVASGGSHAHGSVPDPGATAGTTKFLREDATWAVPAGGGGGSPPGGAVNTLQYQVNSTTFGGIGTYTTDGTTITAGASGVLNLTAQTGVNSLLVPSIAGGNPTTAGALLFDSTATALRMGTGAGAQYLVTRTAGETVSNKTLDNTNAVNQFLTYTNMAAPASPTSGKTRFYVDSTSKNMAVKNDAGTVNHGIQTHAAVAGQSITGINDDGTVTTAAATGGTNAFGTVAVSGQTSVVAAAAPDTINYAAGSGMTITTNAGTNTVTFAASATGGSASLSAPNTFTSAATIDLSATATNTGFILPSNSVGSPTGPGAMSYDSGGGVIQYGNGVISRILATRSGTETLANKIFPATTTSSPAFNIAAGGTLQTSPSIGDVESDNKGMYFTRAAGERGVLPARQWIAIISPYTLTSQTAAQKLFNTPANGTLTVAGNTRFRFRCHFNLSAMSATSGSFGFSIAGTASITSMEWSSTSLKAALGSVANPAFAMWTATSGTPLTTSTTSAIGFTTIEGTLRVGTGGTLIPSVSLTQAAAAVVGTDSWFEIEAIGSDTATSVGNWN